jgi:hypothetical protein
LRGAQEREKLLPTDSKTISIRVCDVTQVQDMEHWFNMKDDELYRAERTGHHRVKLAVSPADAATAIAPTLAARTLTDRR